MWANSTSRFRLFWKNCEVMAPPFCLSRACDVWDLLEGPLVQPELIRHMSSEWHQPTLSFATVWPSAWIGLGSSCAAVSKSSWSRSFWGPECHAEFCVKMLHTAKLCVSDGNLLSVLNFCQKSRLRPCGPAVFRRWASHPPKSGVQQDTVTLWTFCEMVWSLHRSSCSSCLSWTFRHSNYISSLQPTVGSLVMLLWIPRNSFSVRRDSWIFVLPQFAQSAVWGDMRYIRCLITSANECEQSLRCLVDIQGYCCKTLPKDQSFTEIESSGIMPYHAPWYSLEGARCSCFPFLAWQPSLHCINWWAALVAKFECDVLAIPSTHDSVDSVGWSHIGTLASCTQGIFFVACFSASGSGMLSKTL